MFPNDTTPTIYLLTLKETEVVIQMCYPVVRKFPAGCGTNVDSGPKGDGVMKAMTEAISSGSQFICPACWPGNDVCHRVSSGDSGSPGECHRCQVYCRGVKG